MIFHHVLDEVLGQRSKVALLRFLVRNRGEHSGRDLSRLVVLDHKTCHAALRSLSEQGVVTSRRLGTAVAYRLRDDHPVVKDILEPAFEREDALVERFVREARDLSGVSAESIILYGSVVRHEEVARSDVDILFVTRESETNRKVEEALGTVAGVLAARYGSVPQFVVEDRFTFRNKVVHGDPFHNAILRTGRVIIGKPFAELLTDGSKKDRDKKRSSR